MEITQKKTDYVPVSVAARLMGVEDRTIRYYCSDGIIEDWKRSGLRPHSPIVINREEVIQKMQALG